MGGGWGNKWNLYQLLERWTRTYEKECNNKEQGGGQKQKDQGATTLGWTKNGNYKVHLGRFFNVFFNIKNWTKTKKTLKQY